jgi:hypothetical protein
MSTNGLWSITSSADAYWAKQLEAWQAMKQDEFSAESFFRNGFVGVIFQTPKELEDAEYQIPSLDPAVITPAGIATALLILCAIEQDLSVRTQLEGLETTQAKSFAHREDHIRKLQDKIRIARYKTPWERLTNWMKHSFWGKFLSAFIKIVAMIISLVSAVAATVATFGAAAPALGCTIAACCLMTAEMVTELATDGKSIGQNIAESVTKDKSQAQKIAMGIDISLMVIQIALSIGAAACAPTQAADAAINAAEQATEKAVAAATKVAETASKIGKAAQYIEAAVSLIEASINLSYAVSQSELIQAKAQADAQRTKMEALIEWAEDIIDQYMQQVFEALGGAKDAYERVSKIIKEETETKRLIANNLAS